MDVVPVTGLLGDQSLGKSLDLVGSADEMPRRARQWVEGLGNELQFVPTDELAVVVAELVANAASHGAPPVTIRLGRVSSGVRVEVADRSASIPRSLQSDPLRPGGRGLAIVAALSAGWGTRPTSFGKVVWADVVVPRTAR